MNEIIKNERMSSLEIAEVTGKEHKNVLRDIRNLLEQGVNELNFELVDYKDKKGEIRPMYSLTKKGCLILASGYDALLREKIIDRWEELEKKEQEKNQAPTTYLEALKALVASEEEKERLRLESKKKDEDIERMKPKEGYYDGLVDRNLLTNFRDTAKELGLGQKEFINYLLRDGFLYRAKGFRKQLKPCAEYAKDLFAIKDCKSGVNFWAGNQTMITLKGKETFRLLYGEKHNQLALF
jgi:anti-repressor protein